jgi:two-component system OmpR family sensor kinase
MKRMMFWKIFAGSWLIFVFIVASSWLYFNVIHPLPSETTKALSKITLAAAESALGRGGLPELHAQMAAWPVDSHGKLLVRRWAKESAIETDINSGAVSIRAPDPHGIPYQLTYKVMQHLGYGLGPFDTPRGIITLSLVGGLLSSAGLTWYLTNLIKHISSGFRQLASGNFSTRLGPLIGRRKDEVADLARDFDQMAEHLEELVAARDKLLADVSHELRTPLTRLQLAIELVRRDPAKLETSLVRISREASHLNAMVDELLTLSKMESGSPGVSEFFDLADILREVVEDAKFEAFPNGVEIVSAIEPQGLGLEWLVAGSGKLVRRAVENVLRNAVRVSRRGQQVLVTLNRNGDTFHLEVLDNGPGVREEFLPAFFKPFVRRSLAHEQGVGLGLSIAKRAIVANYGSISARNRPGGGLIIAITLPAEGAGMSLRASSATQASAVFEPNPSLA